MHRIAITLILMLTFLAIADFAVAQQRTAVQSVSSNAIPVISTKATGNSKSRSPERLRHKSRAVTTPPAPLSDETTFTIDSSGGSQKSTVNKGSHHILVYLDADKSKTTTVALTSHDAKYTFFALDVTRVE